MQQSLYEYLSKIHTPLWRLIIRVYNFCGGGSYCRLSDIQNPGHKVVAMSLKLGQVSATYI